MGKRKKEKKGRSEYYAIFRGRVEEPTIFSSWGHAHPRITGYKNPKSKGHATLQEARIWMEERGVTKPKEIITSEEENTKLVGGKGFYAVANGGTPGIYEFYCGGNGAEKEVTQENGSCHKRFRTKAQAEAFIEDWKETYAEIWRKDIKKALDEGLRPHGIDPFRPHKMRPIIETFLHKPVKPANIDELSEVTKSIGQLSVRDEDKE